MDNKNQFNGVASPSLLNGKYITEAELRSLRVKNLNKLIIGHLNINSQRCKFELLMHQIKRNKSILMISKTKLDESFSTSQFFMNSFSSPHRLDCNCSGGGILLYIREDILSKLLSIKGDLFGGFFVEINLHSKKKWLISRSYNPNSASIAYHISVLKVKTLIYIPLSMAILYFKVISMQE